MLLKLYFEECVGFVDSSGKRGVTETCVFSRTQHRTDVINRKTISEKPSRSAMAGSSRLGGNRARP